MIDHKQIKPKGFTLIELLVVVAIIGILSAVGVVAYNGYTSGAKKSACKGNFKTMVKTVYENVMWCEINPTIDIAWSAQVVQTWTCGDYPGHHQRGRTPEEQLAFLSMNEITYVDRSRDQATRTQQDTETGNRTTLNMIYNPYNQKDSNVFYPNVRKTPDDVDLSSTNAYNNPYQDGYIVLVKQDEDGNATFLWNEGDLMLYSNCGGELQEHKFELN